MYIILSGSCEVRKKEKVDLAHGASETREKVLIVGTMDEALAQARAAIAAAHEPNWRKRSAAH
jgi:tRNA C32,U32 (ribose-2'-O)-methylase TrmJ